MMGNTHKTAAAALAMTVCMNAPPSVFVRAITAAVVGASVSDVDSSQAGPRKYVPSILALIVASACAVFAYGEVDAERVIRSHPVECLIAAIDIVIVIACQFPHKKESIFSHGGIMHSAAMMASIVFLVDRFLPSLAFPFFLGYSSHLVLDLFNYRGIMMLYPFRKRIGLKICHADGIMNNGLYGIFTAACCVLVLLYILGQTSLAL